MNIHEHQAKQILKKYGATVPNGIFGFSVDDIVEKAKTLNTQKYVLKAQIHAGGRGKAGGIKILKNIDDLSKASKEMLGKILITHQTGPRGKEVKRLYVEESSNINKQLVLGKKVLLFKGNKDKDMFGRSLRYVILSENSIFINDYLVGNGFAKVYEKYIEDNIKSIYNNLKKSELKAKQNNIGRWKYSKYS